MPARIHIVAGVRAGATIWIDKPVIRIGSHPDVDVCLPSVEMAEHLATLEFRDGAYIVYNRSAKALHIDGRELAPGNSGRWHHGGTLDVGDETLLQLELTGDGSPSASPVETAYEDAAIEESVQRDAPDGTEVEATASGVSSESSPLKTVGQVVVILLSCLAIGAMTYSEFLKPKSRGPSAGVPEVESVLRDLGTAIEASTGDERIQLELLRRQLREAEFLSMRGDNEQARSVFEALRLELRRRRDVTGDADSESQSGFLQYVLYRLNEE